MEELNEVTGKASELSDRFNNLMKENEERRVSLEKDLAEINSRLDYNKKAMENAKVEIEKITDILSNLREHTLKFEEVNIDDNWDSTDALEPDNANSDLISKCNSQFQQITSALKESLQKRRSSDHTESKSHDTNILSENEPSRKSAEF